MKAEAGFAHARQREERIFKESFEKASRIARETRESELQALRERTSRLRALREAAKPPRG